MLLLQTIVTEVEDARERQIEDEQQSDHEKVSVMTDMSMSYISQLEEEDQRPREENHELKQALESEQLTEKAFKSFPSSKIKHFTGLPSFVTLMAVFNFIAPLVLNNSGSTLSKFQQFLMVLMKPIPCISFQHSQLYCVTELKKWIDVMYLRLKPLIKRPACDKLLIKMPMSSRKNKTCVIIRDSFKVFTSKAWGGCVST